MGFASVSTELLPAGLLPDIGASFGVSESAAGLLTAGYAGVIVVSVIPLVALTARLPRRPLLLAGLIAFVASNVLLAVSPTFAVAVGARMVGGVAHGLVWALMAPYVARIVPPDRVGRGMAIVFAGNSAGAAAGAPLATALGEGLGWRAAFLVLALPVAVLAVVVARVVPPAPRLDRSASRSVVAAVRRPGVAAVTVAAPLLLLAHFAVLTYIAPFLAQSHVSDSATSASLSLLGVAGMAGIWVAGVTVDRVPRRSLVWATALLVAAFCALAAAGGERGRRARADGAVGRVVRGHRRLQPGRAAPGRRAAHRRGDEPHRGRDAARHRARRGLRRVRAEHGGRRRDPLAAALPAAVALAIIVLARRAAYPPGPRERAG